MQFEANLGQCDARVRFLVRDNASTLFLTPKESVFVFRSPLDKSAGPGQPDGNKPKALAQTQKGIMVQVLP